MSHAEAEKRIEALETEIPESDVKEESTSGAQENTSQDETAEDFAPPPEPSWFALNYARRSPDDMANHYRATHMVNGMPVTAPVYSAPHAKAYDAYRRRIEERFQSAQRLVDPAFGGSPQNHVPFPQRPSLATRHLPTQQARDATRQTSQGSHQQLGLGRIAALAICACVIGSGAGLGLANFNALSANMSGFTGAFAAWIDSWQKEPPVMETVLTKKPVKIAKVQVNDVSGAVNNPIPLSITAFAPEAEAPIALRISGLPQDAYLTKGVEVAEGQWLLKPAEISLAELVIPQSRAAELGLEVTALDTISGTPVAPSQEMRVSLDLNAVPAPGVPPRAEQVTIAPAAAPPETAATKNLQLPQAIPVPLEMAQPEAQGFLNRAEKLLKKGDIIAARQYFLKAYEAGLPAGAFGVGQTYAPFVYKGLKVKNLEPDPLRAEAWFRKAAEAGHPEAQAALEKLAAADP